MRLSSGLKVGIVMQGIAPDSQTAPAEYAPIHRAF